MAETLLGIAKAHAAISARHVGNLNFIPPAALPATFKRPLRSRNPAELYSLAIPPSAMASAGDPMAGNGAKADIAEMRRMACIRREQSFGLQLLEGRNDRKKIKTKSGIRQRLQNLKPKEFHQTYINYFRSN